MTLCDKLDDYLDRGLSEEQSQLFEAHLHDCPGCFAAALQQERLETLLAEAVKQFDTLPAGLISRTRGRLVSARRRRRLLYAMTAAAAAAVVWWLVGIPRYRVEPPGPELVSPERVAVAEVSRPEVRISFANESKLLIVPEKTDSPNVTFMWVYPNLRKSP
jgi:anti-sigma factor RsiW